MNKRISYLDFLRCLSILFVVILHAEIPYLTDPGLYGTKSWYLCVFQNEFNRIGVPMFFMISGYLMLKSTSTLDIGRFYKKRFLRLLPPLVLWNLIYCFYYAGKANVPFSFSAFFSQLINNGSGYHMWFIYTLLGVYLMAPFLKRMMDACTDRQQLLLLAIVLFPCTVRPFLNHVTPFYINLFGPMMEGYIGYFLLGYWLGSHTFGKRARLLFYLGGAAGFLIGFLGNVLTASPEALPLPFNMGYSINHFLCASALMIFFRAFFDHSWRWLNALKKPLARISDLVFGVYWVHALVLDWIIAFPNDRLSVVECLAGYSLFTVLVSLAIALVISRIPLLRKILM